ncbi:hypothetical protein AC623_18735 [Bacillus sp. FJAT-27231]|uniref:DUF4230 domain-containing protein n=1 Tax=Bacillus sp. FJAT-27231 TaxID=1679168 RepID=UPI000670CBBC|nr:DUF4230 domain-containing protein [Bacillus sp. FJAT-27231]KMY55721.1 hypothetical protein AC623_18735 [Bacillus sp. FJAT-27231]
MDRREREKLEQVESILKELKAGQEETASAATAGRVPAVRTGKIAKWLLASFILLLFVLGTSGVISLYTGSKQQEPAAFVEQIKGLNSLATAEAYTKAVIEQEDNKIFGQEIGIDVPGTKRKVLLIIPGKVLAGVDLSKVSKADVKVDEKKKTVEIHIPKAGILQEPALLTDQVKMFSVEGLFRGKVDWKEGYALADKAKQLIEEEAIKQGLLQTAEKNAVQSLEQFFEHVGYKATVKISG